MENVFRQTKLMEKKILVSGKIAELFLLQRGRPSIWEVNWGFRPKISTRIQDKTEMAVAELSCLQSYRLDRKRSTKSKDDKKLKKKPFFLVIWIIKLRFSKKATKIFAQ